MALGLSGFSLLFGSWSVNAHAGGEPGTEGHLFICKGRIDGKKRTLRCCGADSADVHNIAYANFDMDRPPTCEITSDICILKNMGNCRK